jgi:hypothetical protein
MTIFAAPATGGGGEGAKAADLEGHLLLIEPTEYKTGLPTSMGDADAIACSVVDLDTNQEFPDTLFFAAALRASLRPQIGKKVLARMGKGTAKPGKSAPWILIDATADPAAVAKATAYLASGFNAPATPPVPAAPPVAAAGGIDLNDPTIQALMAQLGAKPVA